MTDSIYVLVTVVSFVALALLVGALDRADHRDGRREGQRSPQSQPPRSTERPTQLSDR